MEGLCAETGCDHSSNDPQRYLFSQVCNVFLRLVMRVLYMCDLPLCMHVDEAKTLEVRLGGETAMIYEQPFQVQGVGGAEGQRGAVQLTLLIDFVDQQSPLLECPPHIDCTSYGKCSCCHKDDTIEHGAHRKGGGA
jgi:hypothetical protein